MRSQKSRGRAGLLFVAGLLSAAVTLAASGQAVADPHDPAIETRNSPSLGLEQIVDDTLDTLDETLTGGAYVDDDGDLVVTVTKPDTGLPNGSHSADVKQVDHSLRQLEKIQSSLNRYAERHGPGHVQSWYVDIPGNKVVVTTSDDSVDRRTRTFLRHARGQGSAVTVRRVDAEVRPASSYLYNSDRIDLTNTRSCSVGFNAVDGQGRQIFITAGHCLQGAPAAYRGTYVGSTLGYNYPGSDFGAIRTYTSYWNPEPAVNKYDGQARAVTGIARPPVGSRICKSSAVSGWTCGVVQAYDQTVNYGNGQMVYGLVRFNACVEPGDSGGAVMHGSSAVGVISGAQFYDTGRGAELCGQRVGEPNVSFYQPIGPALQGMNARLLTYANPQN